MIYFLFFPPLRQTTLHGDVRLLDLKSFIAVIKMQSAAILYSVRTIKYVDPIYVKIFQKTTCDHVTQMISQYV